jgi:hypothetical protein
MKSLSSLMRKQGPSSLRSHSSSNQTADKPFLPLESQHAQPCISSDSGKLPQSVAHIALAPLGQPLLRKLAIGETTDPLEVEADRVADRVLRMADPALPATVHRSAPVLRRKCSCENSGTKCKECEEAEHKKKLHRKAANTTTPTEAPPIVHDVLRSPGQPLDPATRAFFEPRFGVDLRHVRIHNDDRASESARSVNALAYAVGNNIAFQSGTYRPNSSDGRRLLAHELAHVVQQGTLASAFTLRRTPEAPQKRNESRSATLDLPDGGTVSVTRTFHDCPCSEVADTRTGVFYNPDLDSLAIAYRHCHGETTFDTYLRTATSFSQGTTPTGDARLGIDVNVWGKNLQGRLIVEAVGANQSSGISGSGIGGHARIDFQGGKWQVRLESQYIRQLSQLSPETNPNQLEVNLGGRYGKYSVELSGKDLLSPTRDITGAGCYALSDSVRLCGTIDVQERSGGQTPQVTPGVSLRIPFGEGARKERCSQCLCPAPAKQFSCMKHEKAVPPHLIPQPVTEEYRYYFAYNKTTPSEEEYLRNASETNMEKLKTEAAKPGYQITAITGYASPEGDERKINDPLALARAKKTTEIVASVINAVPGGKSYSLPKPSIGRSELLGRNPAPPSPHLRDVIVASGLHSAEQVTPMLIGKEILRDDLAPEFLDLFKRTTSDEWMQLFGLSTDDPIRPHIEEAVNTFIASNGKGPRPWERVFRPLRFGAVTVQGTEQVPDPKDKGKPAQDVTLSKEECNAFGKLAEDKGLLGPIDESARRPSSTDAQTDESCWGLKPSQDDINAGCDYSLPADFKAPAPSAPSYAPDRLGGDGGN